MTEKRAPKKAALIPYPYRAALLTSEFRIELTSRASTGRAVYRPGTLFIV